MFLHKIDDTGLFVEDVITDVFPLDANGNPDTAHYITTPAPEGFYWPKWDGLQWAEGGTAPVHVVTVDELKAELAATDYKIIKCAECQLAGLDLPYDITELHTVRQALRDQINALEAQAE